MPLNYTAAASSRIRKKSVANSRSSPSPFGLTGSQKPRPSQRKAKVDKDVDYLDERLDDTGFIVSLASDLAFSDVAQFVEHIQNHMFSPVPSKASGMSSSRIAEILNYRLALPPLVTIAHVQALSTSGTQADRDIARLSHAGVIRKMTIPNRGAGNAAVGDAVVLMSEWEKKVLSAAGLTQELKEKYIGLLKCELTSATISGAHFTPQEITSLMNTGFLTAVTVPNSTTAHFSRPGDVAIGTLSSLAGVGYKAPSGSIAAVGGLDAFSNSGASGSGAMSRGTNRPGAIHYNFSLPNTGSYLKLVASARNHLMGLISKLSKFNEVPLKLLKERWNGGLASSDSTTRAKNIRGEFVDVSPGRTKKWKQFYGLGFDWVLEECVGAGMVECFNTGTVGVGVRIL